MTHIPLQFHEIPPNEMLTRSEAFYQLMKTRRTVREFSKRPVPQTLMENLILTAGTAPSGANKQPWTFCLISNPQIKKEIRLAAEQEERENYDHRFPADWLHDLEPLGTTWEKPFIETAPWLVVIFRKIFDEGEAKTKKNYYVNESVGIATGFFIAALHNAGLVTLTHTPSPMDFLTKILQRPSNERPFLLMPVGYPAEGTTVPDINKKKLDEVRILYL